MTKGAEDTFQKRCGTMGKMGSHVSDLSGWGVVFPFIAGLAHHHLARPR
jgi:hypothetical protein